ncbi:MAG: ABC transporter ATP-binding protein [Dysgonamonadaceae bacterium]|jgi:ABC-type multidrug transport system ATPase subunit|nr:ABC transporter ATP-binding protein [Dysgonamonadaceae bacterium]MDD3726937.1 ABC transporter ATP-binding protein [Dysgonamonadaceae bacterium]MDD4245802.1 ABC transporter ATP-binding protein [Dysgonamonadaceae bacterium]MDD4605181.1 ABC transporter ATP-binding protein [Dysgonamonadaceae bacterium]HUI32729.1 ABC transporter ATP-binding protein [Dysgonamonadaceae bacterium]
MIEVKNLRKNYHSEKSDKYAGIGTKEDKENGISFSVPKGEVFGVIGPDGAGKTTLFRILATLLLADSGEARMSKWDVVEDYKEIRKIIGYMPGKFSLYFDLSVEENLKFFATVFDTTIEENYEFIKDIYQQIEPFKTRRAGALSGGMKQKLALSCALIHQPEILILDEPTTGVDPVSRKEFWDMLKKLKEGGMTILVSTAYMDEATRCDRIALMRDGEFIAIDTPAQVIADYEQTLWSVKGDNLSSMLEDIRAYPQVETSFAFGDEHHITVDPNLKKEELSDYLTEKGYTNISINEITPTVEDCFLALTKEGEKGKEED